MRSLSVILLLALLLPACSTMETTGKVVLTPLTSARDVVDLPLVATTNVFMTWANHHSPNATPSAGVGWSVNGGFDYGIGLGVSHWLFKSCSWIFGGVDYLACRSLYPNFPNGVSPWVLEGGAWGSLWFPNTRALWGQSQPVR